MHTRQMIKDAARLVGVSPSAIRSWERRGLLSIARDWRGARVFGPADVRRLQELAGTLRAVGDDEHGGVG